MSYASPVPKVAKVKATVELPPDLLQIIDTACHVMGRSRNSWLVELVVDHLPELARSADNRLAQVRGARGIPGLGGTMAGRVNSAAPCPTKSPLAPRRTK